MISLYSIPLTQITHKDTDVLLVAISKHIDNDGMDSVASVLLQPHHKVCTCIIYNNYGTINNFL